jgi:predicted patatin/cPLA2 family phospholipase
VEQLEQEGRVTVVRPEKPLEVDRITTDVKKLTALYEEGYACAEKVLGR